MVVELALAFLAGLAGGGLFFFTSSKLICQRIYSLEVDFADLQDRHLRSVRKQAATARWDKDDALQTTISQNASPEAEKKGWNKWGSSKSSN